MCSCRCTSIFYCKDSIFFEGKEWVGYELTFCVVCKKKNQKCQELEADCILCVGNFTPFSFLRGRILG